MSIRAAASAALTLCLAATPAAVAGPRASPPLLDTIALWLTANFDLPPSGEPPALVAVPGQDLVEMRYGPGTDIPPDMVVAVYDDAGGTIYLTENWTGRTPADISVLVHEMVHHLQTASGAVFACPAERERLAYRAQDAWLGLFGESLGSAFGIDAATVLVGTVCVH